MYLGDIARWIVALGCLLIALAALGAASLGKRQALSLGGSVSIGAVFCFTHLIADEPGLERAIDAIMLAALCLGIGALFGHAYRLQRAERRDGSTVPKVIPTP